MKIKKILGQHRRDFTAIYLCQHCEHEQTMGGYDDAHFHNNVIPTMTCPACGKKGEEVTSTATVPPGVVL